MTKTLRLASALGLALLANCTKPNPAACDGDYCPTKALPFCDTDGALEGAPGTCIPVACTPGDFVSCRGDQAIVCNSTGTNYDLSHCDRGCDPTSGCITQVIACTPGEVHCGAGTVERCGADGKFSSEACDVSCIDGPAPHCAYLEPKYLPDICDTVATEDHLDLGPINTSTDQLCNGGIVDQPGAPQICILRYGTISSGAGTELKVTGSRILALVADSDLVIGGNVDLSADANFSGPGAAGVGARRSGGAVTSAVGGGGPGFATSGGAGGAATQDGGAANAGLAFDATTQPVMTAGATSLRPSGVPIEPPPSPGGGGGGAIFISCHGSVNVTGLIDAGGGGGQGGTTSSVITNRNWGGAAGGSGGYVVLQGLRVNVTGKVYANGGSGGNGHVTTTGGNGILTPNFAASFGGDAVRARAPASVAPVSSDEGAGGAGGYEGNAPGVGRRPTGSTGSATGGGGGGSVGAFQVYTPAGVFPVLTPSDASPKIQPGLNVPVR